MWRTVSTVLSTAILAAIAGAADEPKAKRPHPVPLAFYLSDATDAADEAAISAAVKKVKSVSAVDFNGPAGYVRVVFDSHVVSYHQVAQAIADAGGPTGKKYDPRLKMRVPEYAQGENAAKVDALLAGKRLNQRVRIEAVGKDKGEFLIHFLPLELDPATTGPQGFNGGHLNHPIHDPPPRGLGLTCVYATEQEPAK
jgi:copper chaperone CopZ